MTERNSKLISILSFAASILIIIQVIYISLSGEAACLNQGCEIVESLTTIPPLYFNLIGFLFSGTLLALFPGPQKGGLSYRPVQTRPPHRTGR